MYVLYAGIGSAGQPRDFIRSNARAASAIAQRRDEAIRARAAAKERDAASGRWKMDKFRDVAPRLGKKGLRGSGDAGSSPSSPGHSSKPYLQRKSVSGGDIESSPPPARYERPMSSPRKPGVPRAGEALPAPRHEDRDIIFENAVGTIRGEAAALAPSARAHA